MDDVFSISVIERLGIQRDKDTRAIIRHFGADYDGPSPLFLDPDYDLSQLPALAARWGVSLEVLSMYRVLVDYIDQLAQEGTWDDDKPDFTLDQIADDPKSSVSYAELHRHVAAEVKKVKRALFDNLPDEAVVLHSTRPGQQFTWETKADEDADFEEDAGRRGFAHDEQ